MKFYPAILPCEHTGCHAMTERVLEDRSMHTRIRLCESHLRIVMDYLKPHSNMRELSEVSA